MPTVLCAGGYRLYFFSHEPNEPPHVHVDRGADTMKIWLDTVAVAKRRGFRDHEVGDVLRLVTRHRARLQEAWHEHFG